MQIFNLLCLATCNSWFPMTSNLYNDLSLDLKMFIIIEKYIKGLTKQAIIFTVLFFFFQKLQFIEIYLLNYILKLQAIYTYISFTNFHNNLLFT